MHKVLVLEDETNIRSFVVINLKRAGYEAIEAETGEEALAQLKRNPDVKVALLDIMLPGEDGISILKRLRGQTVTAAVPVIMATAKGTEYDKVTGLDLGADDYLVKPFGMMEMVSRVKAVLRRYSPKQERNILAVNGLSVDLAEHTVTADGERVALTLKEFELLRLFLSSPGVVFTRETLLSNVWDVEYTGETRTVDMHIRTLRQKLGRCGAMIETVRGVGYLWSM